MPLLYLFRNSRFFWTTLLFCFFRKYLLFLLFFHPSHILSLTSCFLFFQLKLFSYRLLFWMNFLGQFLILILRLKVPGQLRRAQRDLPARHGSVTTLTDHEHMGPLLLNKGLGLRLLPEIEDLLRPFITFTIILTSTATRCWWPEEGTVDDCHPRLANLPPCNCGPLVLIFQN